jgi:hypothetical protein
MFARPAQDRIVHQTHSGWIVPVQQPCNGEVRKGQDQIGTVRSSGIWKHLQHRTFQ